jgi:hypothetical protein
MDDTTGRVAREHRRRRLLLEGQLPVGVVLEDPETVLGSQPEQTLALGIGEGASGRVVEVGDHVQELQRAGGERRLERLDVEAVLLQRDRDEIDAEPAEQQQRAVVGGLLDRDAVAGVEEVLEEHRAGLERSVGDHHLRRLEVTVTLRDPLAEAGVADPGAVGEGPLPVRLQGARGRLPNRLGRQDVGAGRAAREADHVGRHRARA